jgi:ribosomal protein S18 acetylase RimI-like enzyme
MEIRSIRIGDIPGVVKLMRDFAAFEDLADYCEISEKKLEEVLFGPRSFVESLVSVELDKAVGYCIFYQHFASFRGQSGFYLEDIFIEDGFRGRGLGEAMIRRIAKIAGERGLERIDFQVLDWNESAVNFYFKLGAERDDSERHFKFTDEAFRSLAS